MGYPVLDDDTLAEVAVAEGGDGLVRGDEPLTEEAAVLTIISLELVQELSPR